MNLKKTCSHLCSKITEVCFPHQADFHKKTKDTVTTAMQRRVLLSSRCVWNKKSQRSGRLKKGGNLQISKISISKEKYFLLEFWAFRRVYGPELKWNCFDLHKTSHNIDPGGKGNENSLGNCFKMK